MKQGFELVGIVNIVLFAAAAIVCVRQWRRRRATTAIWAALAFVALSWVIAVGRLLPEAPENFAAQALERIDIALLVLFPYFLYRFAAAFEARARPLARFVDSLSSALVASTFALPHVPQEGDPQPWWFTVYLVAFVVHWSVLLIIVAVRLWRASRTEATVARRRMQMLAFASTTLTVALVLSVVASNDDSPAALVVALLATLSAVAFLFGFSPPAALRVLWRRPEQTRMQEATGELMTAGSEAEVAARVLPPMASMVGARGVAIEAKDGTRLGAYGEVDDLGNGDVARWEFPFGTLVVRTSSFAPFFGDEERKLLQSLGSFTGLALDRARLFAQEREARETLEHADELKSQFVALAAHELRSPVGAIYGLSETIALRGLQLAPEQVEELQKSLTEQICRLRELVEQLLDLSRLDAAAVAINPQRTRVRERLEEIVKSVSPVFSGQIAIEAAPDLEADVDAEALERIVTNLIVNACHYGEPPITVRATQEHGVLHVTVEDSGPGVPEEFVPQLFDRFARGAASAAGVTGTGLGLAIAQSYARAHSGEVSYRPAAPCGAAFELTLPALSAA